MQPVIILIKFKIGNKIYLKIGKAYQLISKENAKLYQRKTGFYKIIYKVLLFIYKLDFNKNKDQIYLIISIYYLYKYNKDLVFNYILLELGLIKYKNNNILGDNLIDSLFYKLDCILNYYTIK